MSEARTSLRAEVWALIKPRATPAARPALVTPSGLVDWPAYARECPAAFDPALPESTRFLHASDYLGAAAATAHELFLSSPVLCAASAVWDGPLLPAGRLRRLAQLHRDGHSRLALLLATAALDRAVGDAVWTVARPRKASGVVVVPRKVRMTLQAPELQALAGPEYCALMTALVGGLNSINLRNLAWHGFLLDSELWPAWVSLLLLCIACSPQALCAALSSAGSRRPLAVLSSQPTPKPPLTGSEDLAELMSAVQGSAFIPDGHEKTWEDALRWLVAERDPDACLVLLLPELEQSLRVAYADANGLPPRMMSLRALMLVSLVAALCHANFTFFETSPAAGSSQTLSPFDTLWHRVYFNTTEAKVVVKCEGIGALSNNKTISINVFDSTNPTLGTAPSGVTAWTTWGTISEKDFLDEDGAIHDSVAVEIQCTAGTEVRTSRYTVSLGPCNKPLNPKNALRECQRSSVCQLCDGSCGRFQGTDHAKLPGCTICGDGVLESGEVCDELSNTTYCDNMDDDKTCDCRSGSRLVSGACVADAYLLKANLTNCTSAQCRDTFVANIRAKCMAEGLVNAMLNDTHVTGESSMVVVRVEPVRGPRTPQEILFDLKYDENFGHKCIAEAASAGSRLLGWSYESTYQEQIKVVVEALYDDDRQAEIVCNSLSVDKELRRDVVRRTFTHSGRSLFVTFESLDAKALRTSVSSMFDFLALATEAVNLFSLPYTPSQESKP
eukprot:m51a1_g6698 hypothetical protein (729) ;mRNA; r:86654-90537